MIQTRKTHKISLPFSLASWSHLVTHNAQALSQLMVCAWIAPSLPVVPSFPSSTSTPSSLLCCFSIVHLELIPPLHPPKTLICTLLMHCDQSWPCFLMSCANRQPCQRMRNCFMSSLRHGDSYATHCSKEPLNK